MNRITILFLFIPLYSSVFLRDLCGECFADEQPKAVRAAVERGLVVLQRGAKEYPSHQSCFACHHQTLPMLAMKAAREAGLKCDDELFRELRLFTRKSFGERQERLAKGEHVGGRAATVSYGLWTLNLAGDEPDELGEAMTAYLLSVQQPDGRWKPPSNRPPLEVSSVSCTVLSAVGIQRFASTAQRDKVQEAIGRARTWLATAPLEEQEDLNFAFWGETLLGGTGPANNAADNAAGNIPGNTPGGSGERREMLRERVLANRHADGGWSQNAALKSDAYATGQTLYVLAETGLPTNEAAFREGIAFLLETQQEDGSWHVVTRSKPIQPWFDNGDPHGKDQFISIAATGWATAALARSLKH